MSENKNQHTIPEVILREFQCDSGRCFALLQDGRIVKHPISTLASHDYYYEFRNRNNEIINKGIYEKQWLGAVETRIGDVISRLFSAVKNINQTYALNKILSQNDRNTIFDFIAQCMHRTPFTLGLASHMPFFSGYNSRNDVLIFSVIASYIYSRFFEQHYSIILHKNETAWPFITSTLMFSIRVFPNTQYFVVYFPISPKYYIILAPTFGMNMSDILIIDDEPRAKYLIAEMSHAIKNIIFVGNTETSLKWLQDEVRKGTTHFVDIPSTEQIAETISSTKPSDEFQKNVERSIHELNDFKKYIKGEKQ